MYTLLGQSPAGAAGLEPSDVFVRVFGDVLARLFSSPWLVVLLALLALSAVIRAVRAVIHGRHPRDPQRRFSRFQRVEILARAGNRCELHSSLFGRCRETEELQADHVHPHGRGGATVVENGQALCRRHNKQKSAQVPWDWELRRLAKRRETYFPPDVPRLVVRHQGRASRSIDV